MVGDVKKMGDAVLAVRSGVCQGYPLSPLLYVYVIDPFFGRVERGPLEGVGIGWVALEDTLRVEAYTDDITVFVFLGSGPD